MSARDPSAITLLIPRRAYGRKRGGICYGRGLLGIILQEAVAGGPRPPGCADLSPARGGGSKCQVQLLQPQRRLLHDARLK